MRRLLSLPRTVPLYTSAVATYHDTLSAEPRPTFTPHLRRRNSPRSRFGCIGFSGRLAQTASIRKLRRTRRVALLVPSHLLRRKSSIRTFGTEDQHHSVGLFLHNKTHITRAASAFSLNHHCKTSFVDPKPRVGRNQQPGRAWQNTSEDHFPQQRRQCYYFFPFV
jgi:hypothetical protein